MTFDRSQNIRRILLVVVFILLGNVVIAQVASNERSTDVIERISPILDKRFHAMGLVLGDPIFIRIFKEEHMLELWVRDSSTYSLFQSYQICAFSGDLGPKTRQGDLQSPEGFYFVTPQRMNPWSNFHLSMNLGYPNVYDRARGYTGDFLMIHGACASIGCYAMTDEGIDEIYTIAEKALNSGQPYFRVHVFPFKMTLEKLGEKEDNEWYPFWENLKTGYDWFEETGIPPNVEVADSKYLFDK